MALEILPDPKALRSGRRERVLAQMAANDIDILVLGRQANVRYVTGAPQLWVAGTRPFGPICEVIRSNGEIHLNSTWDEGIPDEIDHDHLYGLAWNPMTLIEVLKKLPGAATVRRVGTDSLTPTFAQLLPMAFPNAELVDAEPALRTARRIKTADEIAVLRGALGVAEHALDAARSELAAGVTEQSLTGAMMEAMAAGGVTTPATQDGAWITPKDHSWRRDSSDGRVADGDLVALSAGALADGYVGEVGRTWPVGDVTGADALFRRSNELWEQPRRRMSAGWPRERSAFRVRGGRGAAARDARRARSRSRVRPAGDLGGPAGTCAEERLEPGMVLAVTGYVWEPGVGAVFSRDAVLIGDDGAEVLTSSPTYGAVEATA